MPTTHASTGQRIRAARIELLLTMKDVAKSVGVSEATISRIERDMAEPRLPVARKLQQILNINILE